MASPPANCQNKYFSGQWFRCSTFPLQPAGHLTRRGDQRDDSVALGRDASGAATGGAGAPGLAGGVGSVV